MIVNIQKIIFFNKQVDNNLCFNELPKININEKIQNINAEYNKKVNIINNNQKLNEKKKITKIKTLTTKKNNSIINIDKIIKTKKIKIYPTKQQICILDNWFNECTKVYNFCIKKYNKNKSFFEKMDISIKMKIFEELYKNTDKNAPYDVLTDEIRSFLSNLKSCLSNLKNKNITHFELKTKDISKSQSILIPKTAIKLNGVYKSHLGKMKGLEKIKLNLNSINDSRLIYDKREKTYFLCIPQWEIKEVKKTKLRVVSLDPGEKIFMSYFSEIGYGHIGINMRNDILKIEKKIRRYQRILGNRINENKIINNKRRIDHKIDKIKEKYKTKNKKFKLTKIRESYKLKNNKKIQQKINRCYKKIQNKVKELHNKTALYLCKNYDRILIPVFETQNMLRNTNKLKEHLNKIYIEKGKEECKKEVKKIYKKKRLNKRVKFVLNSLSHYKFRMHLAQKCVEYGSEMVEVTEEYTSVTCTNCGTISNSYSKKREKHCCCGYKIDRDINGARNIMLKNIIKVARSGATNLPKECKTVSVMFCDTLSQHVTDCHNK